MVNSCRQIFFLGLPLTRWMQWLWELGRGRGSGGGWAMEPGPSDSLGQAEYLLSVRL